ncbi:MAG: TerB family tellurite resistance protein [Myxococcota bacterium]|nr:TerB family tellurite resistance protein [Myxococcota bacterium]
MSFLLRFLGVSEREVPSGGRGAGAETETVRRIAARLERLPADQARYLAAFSYVLARVANADLRITESETDAMGGIVRDVAGLPEEEAALAVEIAKSQARLLGGTENYVVTREFRDLSTREQRSRLLDCLFAVAAADGTISGDESSEIVKIGEELGFLRAEVNALRARYRNQLSEFQEA